MSDLGQVTAVLISRAPVYPRTVLESLPPFGEMLIGAGRDTGGVGWRYELAALAAHPTIYVQDDDCLVDVEELWRAHQRDGAHRITNWMEPHYAEEYKDRAGITLVGWGAFFPKELIAHAWTRWYPWDAFADRVADRIVTGLNAPHNTQLIEAVHHLPAATAKDRMSQQAHHYEDLKEVVRRLRELQR